MMTGGHSTQSASVCQALFEEVISSSAAENGALVNTADGGRRCSASFRAAAIKLRRSETSWKPEASAMNDLNAELIALGDFDILKAADFIGSASHAYF